MPSTPMQANPKPKLLSRDVKNHEEVSADHEKAKIEQKLKHILGEYGCGDCWEMEGVKGALLHIYGLGKQEHEEKEVNSPMTTTPIHNESKLDEFAPGDMDTNGGPSATAPVLDKKSRGILDGAITACAMAKDASGRIKALEDYADLHGVSYNELYNLITMETGGDYFTKDEVPGSDTNESLIKSYKSFLDKIKK